MADARIKSAVELAAEKAADLDAHAESTAAVCLQDRAADAYDLERKRAEERAEKDAERERRRHVGLLKAAVRAKLGLELGGAQYPEPSGIAVEIDGLVFTAAEDGRGQSKQTRLLLVRPCSRGCVEHPGADGLEDAMATGRGFWFLNVDSLAELGAILSGDANDVERPCFACRAADAATVERELYELEAQEGQITLEDLVRGIVRAELEAHATASAEQTGAER